MGSPVLWGPQDASGNSRANNLESALGFSNGAGPAVIAPSTPVDPTSVATFGNKGDLYVNNSVPALYQKQDSGTTTNWTLLGSSTSVVTYYDGFQGSGGAIWEGSFTGSYGDPTLIAGTANLVTNVSSGISAVAASGSVAGITFTPVSAEAIYIVTAVFSTSAASEGGEAAIQLTDGTNIIGSTNSQQSSLQTTSYFPASISGIYAPGTSSAVTIKLQTQTNTGNAYILESNGIDYTIKWTILQIIGTGGGGGGPTTPAYAQAFFDYAWAWETTSTTLTDPTFTGIGSFIVGPNQGIVLTAASGDLPGVTFTPSASGVPYLVSVGVILYNSTISNGSIASLTDGTTIISTASLFSPAPATGNSVPLTGIYIAPSTSPITLKIQLATLAGGTAEIIPVDTADYTVSFAITEIH